MKPVDLFRQWLSAASIDFEEDTDEDGTCFSIEGGYIGFVSSVSFDTNGDLLSVEAYEYEY